MVKQTYTICLLLQANCVSVFDHFVGLVFKGLKVEHSYSANYILQVTITTTNYFTPWTIKDGMIFELQIFFIARTNDPYGKTSWKN